MLAGHIATALPHAARRLGDAASGLVPGSDEENVAEEDLSTKLPGVEATGAIAVARR